MSTTMPSGSRSRRPELDVDDIGRAVQPLRGPEHVAAKAVGDHHVIADRDAVHQLASLTSVTYLLTQSFGLMN